MFKVSDLWRGQPGHPIHPPLTDATIGTYTFATVAAVLSVLGVSEDNTARAWWLALIVGLIVSAVTAVTGAVDWVTLTRGTPLWRTATSQMVAMLAATLFFALAAIVGHGAYADDAVTTGPFILPLIGFGLLTPGRWLGCTFL